jgi:hypothetical protein
MKFDEIVKRIEEKSHELGINAGWRFLYGHETTLTDNNGILLITLNPGGEEAGENQGQASCNNGHAILNEVWPRRNEVEKQKNGIEINTKPGESPLQKQLQKMFEIIEDHLGQKRDEVLTKSLSGYFIPFRSPNWKSFIKKKDISDEAIEFSKGIWKEILQNQNPRLIICIDKIAYKNLKSILVELDYKNSDPETKDTQWSTIIKVTCDYIEYKNSTNQKLVLIRFPHLSSYKIFSNEISKKVATELLQNALNATKMSA